MKTGRIVGALLVSFAFTTAGAPAEVTVAGVFGDHMVLQRGMPVKVWGTAKTGEVVTVTLADRKASIRTDISGKWRVALDPMKAGGPHQMTVAGTNTITFNDVLIGEVWLCSGQSNMAWPVSRSMNPEKEIAAAKYPQIRLFTMPRHVDNEPRADIQAPWQACTPETVGAFSAVGYFFGRELYKALDVPIGLINSSVGGTPSESWTPREVLDAEPDFAPIFETWKRRIAAAIAAEKAQAEGKHPAPEQGASRPASRPAPDPRTNPQRPTVLYNGMIHPIIPYTIRGVIWYQGESNAGRAYQYRKLFPTMIKSWRDLWGQGDFPFLFVQLANFEAGQTEPFASAWAELREAQTMTLSLPKTGMAVTIDIGDPRDVHPTNKQEVGRRLSLIARSLAHGETLPCSGPMYESMVADGDRIRLRFQHVEGGLEARGGDVLKGFGIAGDDRKFVEARAVIDGDVVVVSSDKVAQPVAVRYAWGDAPEANLYNKAGLPASPFRTDDWPGVTIDER